MGSTQSKGQTKRAPVQARALQPRINLPELPPYQGYPIQYHHIIINATLDVQAHFSFMAPNMSIQATNVEQYYPQLAAMYDQGYKMLVFVSLPGSTKNYGLASLGQSQMTIKFQGIFRKLLPEEMGQQWELRVEKSTLINQMFMQWSGNLFLNSGSHTGSMTDNNHIFQTLNNISQNGGRLISVELTGMAGQQMEMQRQMMQGHAQRQLWSTGTMPMMQVAVDVFYEIPRQPSSERYVYQVVSCPMQSTFQYSFPHGQFHSVINWEAILTQYLGTGWKLVEIFEDYSVSSMTQMSGFSSNITQNKNCLWIFEKPASRLNDNTPYYEGTMVEHWFKTKTELHGMGFGGASVNVTTDWEPVIEHFGKIGWQVVRILETPDSRIEGAFNPTIHTRQMIFFQRLIAGKSDVAGASSSQPQPQPEATGDPAPPPSYNELYAEK
ncbi:uncharacterized protein LOC123529292 [Mercenaria mercenaria]|uniref:uncharacterized protein LOC123529292 n=1 Tax=Mercenaria mercenaria TaxID=6596 RepID=UPI00234F57A3|nr:uncharacterized protein LOC123529292 [Mercenaria mercenaria]XP_045165498.2 uncharacterized protein LOC123529292 [Mercenaria mercenaria]